MGKQLIDEYWTYLGIRNTITRGGISYPKRGKYSPQLTWSHEPSDT